MNEDQELDSRDADMQQHIRQMADAVEATLDGIGCRADAMTYAKLQALDLVKKRIEAIDDVRIALSNLRYRL